MNKPSVTVLRQLAEQSARGNRWANSLPNEISGAFFDNPINDSFSKSWSILVKAYFGEDWHDLVENIIWFDNETEITREDGSVHVIGSLNELCDYFVEFQGWSA